jgi:Transposase domain (DUF772)
MMPPLCWARDAGGQCLPSAGRARQRLFGDDYFADLFTDSVKGRPTVPARVVATVMLLQSFEGLSDREAVERLIFDLRWKAAAGLAIDAEGFHPTVLVGMRNRLRASDRPLRLHEDVRAVARQAGLLRGRKRVLDSTRYSTRWPPRTPSPTPEAGWKSSVTTPTSRFVLIAPGAP